MKKIMIALVLFLAAQAGFAQKFALIDADYILRNIPAYNAAQDKLDKMSENWQKEIEGKMTEIEKAVKDFQADQVLYSDEMKKKKQEELMTKQNEVRELQKKYFGRDGELAKKRDELIKPIQDDVYNAVKELSVEGGYAIVFDTSVGESIMFSDPKYDKSDVILEKLGYKK